MWATSANQADGQSAGDVAGGGEPSETARRARPAVRPRSGAANGFDVQWAPRSSCRAMIVITDTLTDVAAAGVLTGKGADVAVMAGSIVNMKGVTGNDDDAKPAPATRR